jgi:hypothetical protein
LRFLDSSFAGDDVELMNRTLVTLGEDLAGVPKAFWKGR